MGNLNFTLGDWVVLGFCALAMIVAMALLLHVRRQELSPRAKLRASRAAAAEQMAPIATGEAGQMPVYEHVIGDLFATADAVQYQELTGHVDQLAADMQTGIDWSPVYYCEREPDAPRSVAPGDGCGAYVREPGSDDE